MKNSSDSVSDRDIDESPRNKKKGMKSVVRAFVISILVLVGVSYLIQGSQFFDIPGGVDGMTAPYVAGIVFFVVAAVINLAFRGSERFKKVSPAEMAVGYAVLSIGAAAAHLGVVGFTVSIPAFYYFAANRLHSVYRPVFEEISKFIAVKDLKSLVLFYRGGQSVVPWNLWIVPLLVLAAFWTLFFFFTMCLTVIYRKHWTEYEHLQYPLARSVGAVVKGSLAEMGVEGKTSIWKNSLLLSGCVLPIAWGIWGLFHYHFPGIPMPSGYIMLSDYFTEAPWDTLQRWPGIPLYYDRFLLLGIGYLLSMDTTFSVWFLYLLFVPIGRVVEVVAGYQPGMLFTPWEFSRGAFLGFAAILTWNVRRELGTIVRVALGIQKKDYDDKDEPLSYKVAFWGGLASISAIVIFCVAVLDMSLWFVLYMYLFIIANVVWFGRLRAEVGYPDGFSVPEATHYSLYNLFPRDTLGVRNALGFAYYHVPHYAGYGSMWMGILLHNYKLGDVMGVKRRTLSIVMIVAFIVAVISGYIFALPLIYEKGFDNANAWLAFGKNQTFYHLGDAFAPLTSWGSIGFGLVFVVLMGLLRTAFIWFPINPVAVPVVSLGFARLIWAPFLIAWLVRTVVLRYGGVSTDRRVRPFFIGLIAGSVFMSMVSLIHGLILRIVI